MPIRKPIVGWAGVAWRYLISMAASSDVKRRALQLLGKYALPALLLYLAFTLGISGWRAVQETRDGEAWARARLSESLKPWQVEFSQDWESICRSKFFLNNPSKK